MCPVLTKHTISKLTISLKQKHSITIFGLRQELEDVRRSIHQDIRPVGVDQVKRASHRSEKALQADLVPSKGPVIITGGGWGLQNGRGDKSRFTNMIKGGGIKLFFLIISLI